MVAGIVLCGCSADDLIDNGEGPAFRDEKNLQKVASKTGEPISIPKSTRRLKRVVNRMFDRIENTIMELESRKEQVRQVTILFIDHLNSLDPDIKFTSEKEQDRTLPFLDTLTMIQDDGSLCLNIYRKPTHTDQYLNFRSNHPLEHKLGVVKTLLHRADMIITDLHDRETEKQHIKQALKDCGYPKWAIDKATAPKPPQQNNRNPGTRERDNGRITLPYIKTVSEPLRRIFASHGISTCFKPTNTLRQLLVAPKDKTPREEKCGVVYHIPYQETTRQGLAKNSTSVEVQLELDKEKVQLMEGGENKPIMDRIQTEK
ncbi:Hypp2188 [Branchiostoma lanceolatum]|uniref:Hypp2188 protein n=1 Tax=Branchiostoma lanceolatum TaxID=7740 RepID=A0A8K0ESB9_BRALA|nr:Hypp2188 [Branchiostoma lanceolatum]